LAWLSFKFWYRVEDLHALKHYISNDSILISDYKLGSEGHRQTAEKLKKSKRDLPLLVYPEVRATCSFWHLRNSKTNFSNPKKPFFILKGDFLINDRSSEKSLAFSKKPFFHRKIVCFFLKCCFFLLKTRLFSGKFFFVSKNSLVFLKNIHNFLKCNTIFKI
jgi:hypothetical protein